MKTILNLVVVLGVTALLSSAALAGADCSYHKTQAAVDKTDASKEVAAVPAPDKTPTSQMQTAQAAKPAPETKK